MNTPRQNPRIGDRFERWAIRTQAETASILGVSRQCVHILEQRAIAKLMKAFGQEIKNEGK